MKTAIILIALTFHCPDQTVTDRIREALAQWQADGPDGDYPPVFYAMPDELGRYRLTATFARRVDRFDWMLRREAIRASLIKAAGEAVEPEEWYDEATWWQWHATTVIADGKARRVE